MDNTNRGIRLKLLGYRSGLTYVSGPGQTVVLRQKLTGNHKIVQDFLRPRPGFLQWSTYFHGLKNNIWDYLKFNPD